MKRSPVPVVVEASSAPLGEPRTISEAVYRRLRNDIIWGRLEPGLPLRSDDLRQTYEVGISPLREALTRLDAEGLVTSIEQRGFRVAPVTSEDVSDTLETRLVIEMQALAASIRRGGLAWETALVASFHALSRIEPPQGPGKDAENWTHHHRSFHMNLLADCGSPLQMELARMLFDRAERHRVWALMLDSRTKMRRNAASEHRKIFEAAISRNTKSALEALDHHYRTTAETVARAIQQGSKRTKKAG